MRLRPLLLTAAAIAALHCTSATTPTANTAPPADRGIAHIVVAGTTDLHGWVSGHDESLPSGESLRSGGLDVLGGYIANLRAAYPGKVLLVDSGDMFQGTLESNLFEGESVVRAYNDLGYVAAAVGNHEFDFGPVGPDPVARTPDEDPLGALKRNAAMAKYPLLSVNTYEKATGQHPAWLKPYTMVTLDGVKIGIIGATTTDTPVVTTPANVKTLEFREPAPEVTAAAKTLRANGADAVIVLAHMGGACAKLDDPNDLSSCRANSEVMKLASDLAPGTVDAIFAGHTHSVMRHIVNGTPVIQAPPMGRGLSMVDLWIDRSKHRVDATKTTMRPLRQICSTVFTGTERCVPTTGDEGRRVMAASFEGQPVEPDRVVAAVLDPFQEKVAQKKQEALGITLAGPFTGSYGRESTLGDLIADALRRSVPGADFAIVNSGGLRADLNAGAVTFGSIFSVLPFDNARTTITLSGAQFRELMRLGTIGKQGIMQLSGGRIVLDPSKPEEQRVVSLTKSDGTPVRDDQTYTLVTNDFLAAGGDGLLPLTSTLKPEQIHIEPEMRIRDVVIAELQKQSKNGPIVPRIEDRIHSVQ